ncbi:hypothetical protein SDC9_06515 [bioreactor metagenome]|uniref:NAD-specific glutamate dehydrogenase n=1 Tax=bioreactor metagenome TaxID=1076179 RepID=A0A644T217_9ZZZZ
MAGDRRRRRHRRRDEVGAAVAALTALEVAVRGRGAALARAQLVRVHREAHRAAGKPPLKARVDEDLCKAFLFRLQPDETRAGHDHGAHAVLDLLALHDLRRGAQVLDPAVGARADEDRVDLDIGQLHARGQPHVVERALRRLDLAAVEVLGRGHHARDRQHVLGRGAPGHHRLDLFALQRDDLVEMRAFVGEEGLPPAQRGLELRALRRVRTALDVFKGGLVGGDQTSAGAALDRHVAHRHPAFHRQITDRLAAIFDDMAGAAGGAGLADHRQGDVLGGDARTQLAGDLHLHVLRLLLDQRLRRQNVLDLRGADAMGERAEGAMRRGVAVTTDHGHPRQRPALLGPDDVHDALTDVGNRVVVDAEVPGVLVERLDLDPAFLVLDPLLAVGGGRNVVVGNSDGLFRRAHLATGQTQPLEGLRAGHLVHEVAVDVEQAGAVSVFRDDVGIPDLVIEGLRSGHGSLFRWLVTDRAGGRAQGAAAGDRDATRRPRADIKVGRGWSGFRRRSALSAERGHPCRKR